MNRLKVGHKPESNQDIMKEKASASDGENAAPSLAEQISRRAYELYEQRGREDGYAEEDWVRAEKEIEGSVNTNSQTNEGKE